MGSSIYFKYHPGEIFGGRRVLNVGCGFAQYKAPNVVNLDAFDVCKPDVVWDLNKTPFPFKDNTFDLILANHIFEHLPNWWGCFEECARILKPKGRIEVYVPGAGSDSQLGYRDHVHIINHFSFFGVGNALRNGTNAWAAGQKDSYAAQLECVGQTRNTEKKWWIKRSPQWLQLWMANHLRNVVFEEGFFFQKKGGS